MTSTITGGSATFLSLSASSSHPIIPPSSMTDGGLPTSLSHSSASPITPMSSVQTMTPSGSATSPSHSSSSPITPVSLVKTTICGGLATSLSYSSSSPSLLHPQSKLQPRCFGNFSLTPVHKSDHSSVLG